ncbi:hypothetical protein A2154_01195 [Candidatus Gottesmanbacteria bacterium RBG_16_43_7]|uniref:N-acetyltransferase domain-containing protein n=1 Tax=Candidatus Gottesmanbacteria bacterium RBG_16_43_7 TaxID=1798373 RepID=A0A1F5ZAJ7_9BACT|nr:MAG: hypothetical protein A2154_01195 [Candidatus Gottesmanbacteria bacterium RBG_16_43_7]
MPERVIYNGITITKADRSQSREIVDIILAAWLYSYPNDVYRITAADVRSKFGSVAEKELSIGSFLESINTNANVSYLTASSGGVLSGFIYATSSQYELYINALYVHPKYHRQGIGGSLLQAVFTANTGIERAVVDVVSYNFQAIAFYKKYGFITCGESETPFGRFPEGKIIPEIIMKKNFTVN